MADEERVALVTGSSKGIGQGIAVELASRGMDVAVNYYSDEEGGAETVRRAEEHGAEAEAYQCDVGDHEQVDEMVSAVQDRFGRLDVVVSNAVQPIRGSVMDMTPERWRRGMDVTCSALLFLARAAVPAMRERGQGWFIGTTSLGSQYAIDNYVSLGVTKAAMEHLMRYMAAEFGPDGIRCNLICPGLVDTQAAREVFPDVDIDDWVDMLSEESPAGRQPSPREIGRIVAFLCSEDADLIVGQNIVIDGGRSLRL